MLLSEARADLWDKKDALEKIQTQMIGLKSNNATMEAELKKKREKLTEKKQKLTETFQEMLNYKKKFEELEA